jgi:hypothetical protein
MAEMMMATAATTAHCLPNTRQLVRKSGSSDAAEFSGEVEEVVSMVRELVETEI